MEIGLIINFVQVIISDGAIYILNLDLVVIKTHKICTCTYVQSK